MSLTDALGTSHVRVTAGDDVRIVSLVPSLTELLCDLGLGERVVGRTGFCIHPADQVKRIPKIGGTKSVNIEKIRRLAPTHLVVNVDENEKLTVEALAGAIPGLRVIVTHPQAPEDNLALYRLFGGIFGAESAAERLAEELQTALTVLSALLESRAEVPPRQSVSSNISTASDATNAPDASNACDATDAPDALNATDASETRRADASAATARRVLYCIWKDPWMTVSRDTYIARMLALIGWEQTAWPEAIDPRRYPAFTWAPALIDSIDEVLLSSEPYQFQQSDCAALSQAIGKPVRRVDGEMLSWYGSRAIQGVHYLRDLAAH